jgi:FtsZ-binding cell division protein ZapB
LEPDRPRRSTLARLFRLVLLAAVMGGLGLFAFQLGTEDERSRQGRLADETAKLAEANQQLAESNQALRAQLQTAQGRLKDLEGIVGATPRISAAAKDLMPTIEKKLAEGADPKRLAEAMAAIDKPRDCEQPETKRFLIKTALTQDGPNTSVGFSNGIVTVSGQGATAKNAKGRPEAWFEPNEPVTVRFTQIGGKSVETAGKLPIHHTLNLGQSEHRFSVMASSRGFVQVTSERCKLP